MNNKPRLGWIGTGVMGHSMAGHLLAAGYPLTVYSRTKAKAEGLLACGARWAETPREVARNADIVFSIVGYPRDVEDVMLGEQSALSGLEGGGILCDMTTSSPELARRIAAAAAARGCASLDAPVTGGDIGAREARLSIFVGGDKEAFERVRPCFEAMGKNILHCGAAGTGQQAKLANQVAIAGVMFSVCESLLFAQEAGLDVRQWLELVVPGAAGSTAMGTLGRRLLGCDYAPGFFVEHFIKDLGLCLEECKRMGLVLPGVALAEQVYRLAQARGHGKDGTQVLLQVLAELSGKQWRAHA
ncbi:NAD(P)-dependent oxidoreductase [Desulfovibrio piger]|uniref:2-hydroxy-3-oxopropionate reductase n=1 Tax=Desulfovibrio piger TaxID=901 RepID=A0A1K1LD99_9BACT|nr:NAD(P)-dependent oxidoreductase [Desulfovibrio piger]SFV72688.1 2-hydroxy-3-oxopropionate reductase [Desulfovibrio piger]